MPKYISKEWPAAPPISTQVYVNLCELRVSRSKCLACVKIAAHKRTHHHAHKHTNKHTHIRARISTHTHKYSHTPPGSSGGVQYSQGYGGSGGGAQYGSGGGTQYAQAYGSPSYGAPTSQSRNTSNGGFLIPSGVFGNSV